MQSYKYRGEGFCVTQLFIEIFIGLGAGESEAIILQSNGF